MQTDACRLGWGIGRIVYMMPNLEFYLGGQITEAAAGQVYGHGAATGSRVQHNPELVRAAEDDSEGCSLFPKGYGFGPKDERSVGG